MAEEVDRDAAVASLVEGGQVEQPVGSAGEDAVDEEDGRAVWWACDLVVEFDVGWGHLDMIRGRLADETLCWGRRDTHGKRGYDGGVLGGSGVSPA